ncbi:hypothetical protein ACMUMQ_08055 [Marinomonas sp. 2405UD66-6]|uniref:hypothetical protein n=1 Tax=Marinomonas sp. 2405UD66-6 TaxID=3391834 RepID=UPI0039C9E325
MRDNDEILEANSERECAFYSDYLLKNIRSASIKNLRGNTHEERVIKLNEELEGLIKKSRAPKNFASQMRSAFKATQLSIQHFRWLDKKDERLCNWLWCYLKKATSQTEPEETVRNESLLLLSAKAFQIERDTAAERQVDILDAFYHGEATASQQQEILELLKAKWHEIRQDVSVTNWLEDNNPTHWSWAWSYLQNNTQRPLEQAWLPSNDVEKRAAVIATLDLSDNVDRKALVIDKMKKAWSQKKFREKSSGKKPYSISMTLNTKQKLNAMAEEKGMKINEMIEYLVQNEFKNRAINE